MASVKNIVRRNRVLALDFGRVHTGAAISDPTGTLVRPLGEIAKAGTPDGLKRVAAAVDHEGAGLVVVGMPVSLGGGLGRQARETEEFIMALQAALQVPVIRWDERFTSKIAGARCRYSGASTHSLAACVLLEDYLSSAAYRRRG